MLTEVPARIVLHDHGGAILPYEADGHISKLHPMDRVRLLVCPTYPQARCITVDKAKQVVEPNIGSSYAGGFFNRWVQLPARYEDNHLRLVQLTPSGRLTVTEIAVVTQGRHGFLTIQRVYDEQCYRGRDSSIVVPRFCKPFTDTPWPEFVAYLNRTFRKRRGLPYVTAYQPPSRPTPASLALRQARIEWYSLAQRCGIATTGTGDKAIVLAQDVPQNGTRLRFLEAGQVVRYNRLVPQEVGCPFRLTELALA